MNYLDLYCSEYRTAGYCCEVQNFATLLKWPLAEISAIAKFARYEADLHWILCQESVEPNLLTRKYKNFSLLAEIFASLTFIRKFRKNLDLAHITRCTVVY